MELFWTLWAPFLTTLGTLLVILGTPGHLLDALGAQRRPMALEMRKGAQKSLTPPPGFGHHFETFSVKMNKKHEFGLPFLGPVSISLFCGLLGRISDVFWMYL